MLPLSLQLRRWQGEYCYMGCNLMSQRSSEFLAVRSTILLHLSPDKDIFANHTIFLTTTPHVTTFMTTYLFNKQYFFWGNPYLKGPKFSQQKFSFKGFGLMPLFIVYLFFWYKTYIHTIIQHLLRPFSISYFHSCILAGSVGGTELELEPALQQASALTSELYAAP